MLGRLQSSDNVSVIPYTAVQQFCVSAAIDTGVTVPLERGELHEARGSGEGCQRGAVALQENGKREGVGGVVENDRCPQAAAEIPLSAVLPSRLPRVTHSYCPHRLEAQDIALSRR